MEWSSFEFRLFLESDVCRFLQRRCRGRVCYRPHPKVLALSRIVEADKLTVANANASAPGLVALGHVLALCNNVIVVFAAIALIAACVILTADGEVP
jgi:hypothetical protein